MTRFLVAMLLAVCVTKSATAQTRFEYAEPHMGTTVRLVLWADSPEAAESAAREAFETFARLDSLFSDWRTDSEIAGVARAAGNWVYVSPELVALLSEAMVWRERTGGAFSPTLGPLTRLWRWSVRRGELPARARLHEARRLSGVGDVAVTLRVDASAGRVRLSEPGMSLDLGGIAKGWAAQRVLDDLRARGLPSALVDAGGDLTLGTAPPGAGGWSVEFPDASRRLLSDVAVATSGDRHRWLEADGVRYSHIVSPVTGLGVTNAPTVVVVARDGTTADVLASAITAMSKDEIERLMHRNTGFAVSVLHADGTGWRTPGFPALVGDDHAKEMHR